MIVRSHKGAGRDPRVFPAEHPSPPSRSFTIHGNPTTHDASVYAGQRPAGFLHYNEMEEAIGTIYLSPQFRGVGLGTRMYHAAGRPAQSTLLTEQGERFTEHVGAKMAPGPVVHLPPLEEELHQEMLPDFARYGAETATRRQNVTMIPRRRQ